MNIDDYSCKFFKSNEVLNSFLADVRKYDVPTAAEEEELYARYKAGDEAAKDILIVGNLRFVYSLAKIYARNESEVVDYVNEGVVGLMKALEDFDPSKGCKFLTWGVWYIRRQMNYYMLTKRDIVAHSAQVGNITKKAEAFRQKYYAENGCLPSDEEIKIILKENYNLVVSKSEDLFESSVASLDDDVSDDYTVEETDEYNAKTATLNEYEYTSDKEYYNEMVKECMKALPEKAARIISLKFGIGEERAYSSEEIGAMLNLPPERVDDICEAAIEEMRKVNVAKRAI